ncbi:GNAT family N-acetyltransferase [Pseudoalteromonas sp. DL2-H2.2]|uniref:GNAT family N-acetyltransferase n=1 Tax=Pseudoalteromonas sp. DL2-H2.2 TaxID=2908889 RepID=UPI001F163DB8|nr:GNAT family N-acetyltransferase [Pseudoalteromonas sp. DL2-H2.2]MCF2908643.1 GNAT family N-acetyltransferase [Pseudoalteromonas sp. DL2-H2.2]
MTNPASSAQLTVKHLLPEDSTVAASLLYRAYHDDKLFKDVLGGSDAQTYESRLRALIREELSCFGQSAQPLIGLYQAQSLLAIACVFEAQTELQASRRWDWRLRLMMSAGYLQTQQLIDKEKTIREALADQGHYYFLSFIAVEPHYQGQGLGHHLLDALDELVKENPIASGLGVFVSEADQNAFFRQHGYEKFQVLTFKSVQGELLFKARAAIMEKSL